MCFFSISWCGEKTGPSWLHGREWRIFQDVCDAGFYYDDGAKKCRQCPRGTYQEKRGGLSCLPCPSDSTTVLEVVVAIITSTLLFWVMLFVWHCWNIWPAFEAQPLRARRMPPIALLNAIQGRRWMTRPIVFPVLKEPIGWVAWIMGQADVFHFRFTWSRR